MTFDVAVLGLGEAGSTLASGLAAAGCAVRSWDPVVTAAPAGVARTGTAVDAVTGADLVLSLTTAAHAVAPRSARCYAASIRSPDCAACGS